MRWCWRRPPFPRYDLQDLRSRLVLLSLCPRHPMDPTRCPNLLPNPFHPTGFVHRVLCTASPPTQLCFITQEQPTTDGKGWDGGRGWHWESMGITLLPPQHASPSSRGVFWGEPKKKSSWRLQIHHCLPGSYNSRNFKLDYLDN